MGWLSLFFFCDGVNERLLAKFLSALTATVMSPSGRTRSLWVHTEMALCELGAKQAGFPGSTSWETPFTTADRKSSVEQTCITEILKRYLGELPGPSHPPPVHPSTHKPFFWALVYDPLILAHGSLAVSLLLPCACVYICFCLLPR